MLVWETQARSACCGRIVCENTSVNDVHTKKLDLCYSLECQLW